MADVLGISHAHARKLGCGFVKRIPVSRAEDFERRTEGALKARELLLWALEAA